jgi:hypothetical protein
LVLSCFRVIGHSLAGPPCPAEDAVLGAAAAMVTEATLLSSLKHDVSTARTTAVLTAPIPVPTSPIQARHQRADRSVTYNSAAASPGATTTPSRLEGDPYHVSDAFMSKRFRSLLGLPATKPAPPPLPPAVLQQPPVRRGLSASARDLPSLTASPQRELSHSDAVTPVRDASGTAHGDSGAGSGTSGSAGGAASMPKVRKLKPISASAANSPVSDLPRGVRTQARVSPGLGIKGLPAVTQPGPR